MKEKEKTAAYKFGSNVLPGAGLGAALGGLYGFAAPGSEEEYDDEGRLMSKQPRSRLAAMLRGALGGGLLGGAGGVAADQYAPNATNDAYNFARGLFTGKSKAELTRGDNVAKLTPMGQSVDRQARTIGQRIKAPALRMPPPKPQFGPDRPIDIRFPNASDFDASSNDGPMGPGDPHA